MITFNNLNSEKPYRILKEKYEKALELGQKNIEAISISSYNKNLKKVDSRFVNLKFINNHEFIFFSNYDSPKSISFKSHSQISALIFWQSINTQIRISASIKKTSKIFNDQYFRNRSPSKNALAISSSQSEPISSFKLIKENYEYSLANNDLKKCPEYWGGFVFTPFEMEFWEGNEFRLNKRNLYKKDNKKWNHYILEP